MNGSRLGASKCSQRWNSYLRGNSPFTSRKKGPDLIIGAFFGGVLVLECDAFYDLQSVLQRDYLSRFKRHPRQIRNDTSVIPLHFSAQGFHLQYR